EDRRREPEAHLLLERAAKEVLLGRPREEGDPDDLPRPLAPEHPAELGFEAAGPGKRAAEERRHRREEEPGPDAEREAPRPVRRRPELRRLRRIEMVE